MISLFEETDTSEFMGILTKTLGISEDEVTEMIEGLDIDALSDLCDACMRGDTNAIKKLVDDKIKKKESNETDEPNIGDLLAPKDKLRKKKDKAEDRHDEKEVEEAEIPHAFGPGDEARVDGKTVTVKIPSAAGDTVGVLINGELKMVDKKRVKPVAEGVLGMSTMPGLVPPPDNELKRIRELAGLPADDAYDAAPVDSFDAPVDSFDAPVDSFDDDSLADDSFDAPEPAVYPAEPATDAPGVMPPAAGLGPVAPQMGDALPALPSPDDVGDDTGGDLASGINDAMALDQAISDIEAMIPNVKISEYKSLVARLKSLVAMAESAGKAALTEHHRRRVEEGRIKNAMVGAAMAGVAAGAGGMAKGAYDYHRGGGDVGVSMSQAKSNNDWKDIVKAQKRAENRRGVKADEDKIVSPTNPFPPKGASKGAFSKNDPPPANKPFSADEKGRKTLMDYVAEAEEGHETLGFTRADAAKALQSRMGAGTTPQDANKALDALIKDGGARQLGSAYVIPPTDDNTLKLNLSAVSNSAVDADGEKMDTPSANNQNSAAKTVNPNANIQGAPNPSFQGR